MSVPVYTFNYFDPEKSVALGTVVGKHAEAISLGRSVVAGVKGIFGGKASEIEKKLKDTINGAKEDIQIQLRQEFPNATSIIGLDVQLNEMGGFIIVIMSGTAIGNKTNGGSISRNNKTL